MRFIIIVIYLKSENAEFLYTILDHLIIARSITQQNSEAFIGDDLT